MNIGDQILVGNAKLPGKIAFWHFIGDRKKILVEYNERFGGMTTDYCAAVFPEIAQYLTPGKFYSWWHDNEVELAVYTIQAQSVGCNCIHCFEYNSYAVPNFNGKFLCYSCRSTNSWKYEQ